MSVTCGLNVRMMMNNLVVFPSLAFWDSLCVLELLFIAEVNYCSQESRLSTVTLFVVSLLCVLQNNIWYIKNVTFLCHAVMGTLWTAHCDGDVYWKTKRQVKVKNFGDLMPCSLVDNTIVSVNVLLLFEAHYHSCGRRLLASSCLPVRLSVGPCVHMYQRDSQWTDFREIWYLETWEMSRNSKFGSNRKKVGQLTLQSKNFL
jgi:hypothetical protein